MNTGAISLTSGGALKGVQTIICTTFESVANEDHLVDLSRANEFAHQQVGKDLV